MAGKGVPLLNLPVIADIFLDNPRIPLHDTHIENFELVPKLG
jgi:hypothetical protein